MLYGLLFKRGFGMRLETATILLSVGGLVASVIAVVLSSMAVFCTK